MTILLKLGNRTIAAALTSIASLFLALTALPYSASGDSVVWNAFVPPYDLPWSIDAAYQVEDEVWLVRYSGQITPTTWMVSHPLELDVPSIMVTRLVNQYEISDAEGYVQLLYTYTNGYTGAYDPFVGDKWINHPAFGWCWTGYLPWVWLSEEGSWAYVVSGGNAAFGSPDNTWWIWTSERGWFWTAQRIYPWKWQVSGGWTNS